MRDKYPDEGNPFTENHLTDEEEDILWNEWYNAQEDCADSERKYPEDYE